MTRTLLTTFAALALASPALAGGPFIIDVNARNSIGLNRFLDGPGTWEFRVIGPAEGGQYTAYNAWGGNVVGCPGPLPCGCATGWSTGFLIDFDGTFSTPLFFNGSEVCDSPANALANAKTLRMVVTGATPIFIKHTDNAPSDNVGGVSVLVTRITDCLADVNNDGVASPADFTAWLQCFGDPTSAGYCASADVNGSGTVDPADFTAWLAAFNAGCP